MKKLTITLALAAATLITAAGCSVGLPAAKGTSAPASAPATSTASPAPKSSSGTSKILTIKFGETTTYADGVSVTLKYKGAGTAGQYAAPSSAAGGEIQIFEVTLHNAGSEPFDPSLFYETGVYGTTGTKAEKVFDSSQGFKGDNFSGLVIPGGTQTLNVAWAIPSKELATTVFTMQPGLKHNKTIVMGGL